MMRTLIGYADFRKGMELYFDRNDGQAVTCDDFRQAMAEASGKNLDQFERWYQQAPPPLYTSCTPPLTLSALLSPSYTPSHPLTPPLALLRPLLHALKKPAYTPSDPLAGGHAHRPCHLHLRCRLEDV